MYSDFFKTFCTKHQIHPTSIDIACLHTSTLAHLPAPRADGSDSNALCWHKIFTKETGIITVTDFCLLDRGVPRPRISPLALAQKLYFTHPTEFRVLLKIGEIATFGFFPASAEHGLRPAVSRNCGPGSLLIDYAMRYFAMQTHDKGSDGESATKGKVHHGVVDRFLSAHDYLRIAPDRSMANEMFGSHEAQELIDECCFLGMSDVDTLATITRITAQNIAGQYRRLLRLHFRADQKVDQLYIYGPGSKNVDVVDYLKKELPECVSTASIGGLALQTYGPEAVCYAQLALEAMFGRALRCSTATQDVTT
jgi:1,6-anhydro-N-acetylmuramate kinase